MVQNPENLFQARGLKAVVERGGEIEQDQRGPINAETDHPPGIPKEAGKGHEDGKCRDAESRADTVRDAARDFLSQRVPISSGRHARSKGRSPARIITGQLNPPKHLERSG